MIKKLNNKVIIEKIADLEHQQWAEWTSYMLNNLNDKNTTRWNEQIKTDYKNLPENQKWSDRKWARKVLKLISKNSTS